MHCEGKLELRTHNTSYYLIEVVIKASLTAYLSRLSFPQLSGNHYIAEKVKIYNNHSNHVV